MDYGSDGWLSLDYHAILFIQIFSNLSSNLQDKLYLQKLFSLFIGGYTTIIFPHPEVTTAISAFSKLRQNLLASFFFRNSLFFNRLPAGPLHPQRRSIYKSLDFFLHPLSVLPLTPISFPIFFSSREFLLLSRTKERKKKLERSRLMKGDDRFVH